MIGRAEVTGNLRKQTITDSSISTFTFEHGDMRLTGVAILGPELHVHIPARPAFLLTRCHHSRLPRSQTVEHKHMDTRNAGSGSAHRQCPAPKSCRAVMLLIRDCETARHGLGCQPPARMACDAVWKGICAPSWDATSQSGFDMLDSDGGLSPDRDSIGKVLERGTIKHTQ